MSLHDRLIAALQEDVGPGDLTSDATLEDVGEVTAHVVAKSPLVVSGHRYGASALAAAAAFLGPRVAPGAGSGARNVHYEVAVADGQAVEPGTVLAVVRGDARSVMVGERLALNLMMRATGIATHVRDALAVVGEATFRAVDTRKSTPLWRDLEKDAVRHGGGRNHRHGLFDGVMIKDNHIAAVGGITQAVARVKARVHHLVKIEVEVEDLAGLREAIAAGADVLLLDNMDDALLRTCIAEARALNPAVMLEASGNMDATRMARIADFGLDVVSVGGFIHQARWADLSMKVQPRA